MKVRFLSKVETLYNLRAQPVAVLRTSTITMASVGRIPVSGHALSFTSAFYTTVSKHSPPTLMAVGDAEDWVIDWKKLGCARKRRKRENKGVLRSETV